MKLKLLIHEEFGEIRIEYVDGEPWFVAKDVCASLDIKQTSVAIKELDGDEKGVISIHTLGGNQDMLHVNESGLYGLIFQSRKPVAKKFLRWVTREVLPSIRKTGGDGASHLPAPMPRLEMYSGELCISYGWLMQAGIAKKDTIKNSITRGLITRVRRGCKGTPALLVYNSLPALWKKRIEERYGVPQMPELHAYKYTTDEMLDLMGYVLQPGVKKTDIVTRLLKDKGYEI